MYPGGEYFHRSIHPGTTTPMLETLISSKTRIKLLLKFFLNSENQAHLRGLESEFGESSNAIRLELNKLEEAGLLQSVSKGNKKMFGANTGHPLFGDIHSILMKYTGLDSIIENVANRLGNLEKVYLVGELGKGLDSPIIDLIFVGEIDEMYLLQLTQKAEKLIGKKIRNVNFSLQDFETARNELLTDHFLLLWNKL